MIGVNQTGTHDFKQSSKRMDFGFSQSWKREGAVANTDGIELLDLIRGDFFQSVILKFSYTLPKTLSRALL